MEREEAWEKEEEEGSLVRTRRGKSPDVQDESRSVYLDEKEGMWKCRHCLWNYRMGSHGMDHIFSHEDYVKVVVNAKTLSQLGSCFFSQDKGTGLIEENAGTNFSNVAQADVENNHGNGEAELRIKDLDTLNCHSNLENNRNQIDTRGKSKIGSNITSSTKTKPTSLIESTFDNLPQKAKMNSLQSCDETPQKDDVGSAYKNFEAVEITDIDNSKSPMNMKTQSQLDSKFISSKGHGESGTTTLEPVSEATNASSHGTLVHSGKAIVEMDVERVLEEQDTHDLYCPNCHSCITKRVILRKRKRTIEGDSSGTKPKRIEPLLQPGPGESRGTTDEPSHETGPEVFRCLSCFSIFIPTADGFKSFWIFGRNSEGENLQSPLQTPPKNLSWISAMLEPFRAKKSRNEPGELTPDKSRDNAAESVVSETQKPYQETSQGPLEPGETEVASGVKWNGTGGSNLQPLNVNEEQGHPSEKNNDNELASPFLETPFGTNGQKSIGNVPSVGDISVIPSTPGVLLPNRVPFKEERPEAVATPTVPEADIIQPVGEAISTDQGTIIDIPQQNVDTTRRHEWDILKSIVYGGLVESVTSLGVVSSAAGSDANTLNIVALGLANLIGGLFVIVHNLREIKKEQVIGGHENEGRLDRYQETLGRRENFRRHVVAAVLSYVIFGLIPPMVYGFSFRKSDNKEYKLIAVAAASLVCIALLAIGKAHVGKAPKTYVATLLYYISIVVMASGLSYAAGQLFNQLLEKLGLFHSSSAASTASLFLGFNSSAGFAAGRSSS